MQHPGRSLSWFRKHFKVKGGSRNYVSEQKGQKIYYNSVASFTQEEETKEVKITYVIYLYKF